MHVIAKLCKWLFILLNVGLSWSWISKTIEYVKYNTIGSELDLFSCEFESYTINSSCGCKMHVQNKTYFPLAQDTWCGNKVIDDSFIYIERKSVMIDPSITKLDSDFTYFGYIPICINPGSMAGISFTPRGNWTKIRFKFQNKESTLIMAATLNNLEKTVEFNNKHTSEYGQGFPFITDETHLLELEVFPEYIKMYVNGSPYHEYHRTAINITPISFEIIFKDVPSDLHYIMYRRAEDILH